MYFNETKILLSFFNFLLNENCTLLLYFLFYLTQPALKVYQFYLNQIILMDYILFLIMKPRIYPALCLLLLLAIGLAQKDPVKLVYYVEHEVQQENDFIEITLEIKAESRTLADALASAKKTAESVATVGVDYCIKTAKNPKNDCKDAAQVPNLRLQISQFQIQPKYKLVRKEAEFQTFLVTHEVVLKALDTERIGYLADSLLKYQDVTMAGFEWQPLQEVDSEETAIKEGIDSGDGLCKQLGLSFGSILHVEEIIEQEEELADKQEDQEEEDQPQIVTYKFQIECIPSAKKTKGK